MAINIEQEQQNIFNPQMIYNAVSNAIQDAYDDGFMNTYIMEHSLYNHLFVELKYLENEEEKFNQIQEIHENPLIYWMDHIEEIKEFINNYSNDLINVARIAETWYQDYTTYAYSMRGMLDNLSEIMTGVTQRAEDELAIMNENGDLEEVKNIARKWGIDNSGESLFESTIKSSTKEIPIKKIEPIPLAMA